MADIAPAFKPDHDAAIRLLISTGHSMVAAFQHMVDAIPAAAGLRGHVRNMTQNFDRASALLEDPHKDKPSVPLRETAVGADYWRMGQERPLRKPSVPLAA